jgi:excisionase family DNA binding protein
MDSQPVERSFCTTREAAALLGVSVGTVQLWVENGLLEAWKTAGGHRRVLRESVDRLVRKPPPRAARASERAEAAETAKPWRPTVMVVEDDIHLLRLYEARISRWPLSPQVLCLNNAVLALLRIGRSSPDMLILDLNIPGMDGFAMLHHLRHSGAVEDTTIAVVTGMDESLIEARGGLPGDVDVYSKPVPFDSLQALWRASAVDGQSRFGALVPAETPGGPSSLGDLPSAR